MSYCATRPVLRVPAQRSYVPADRAAAIQTKLQ